MKREKRVFLYRLVFLIITFILIFLVVRFVRNKDTDFFVVTDNDMANTLRKDDIVVGKKNIKPKRYNIVVFNTKH